MAREKTTLIHGVVDRIFFYFFFSNRLLFARNGIGQVLGDQVNMNKKMAYVLLLDYS